LGRSAMFSALTGRRIEIVTGGVDDRTTGSDPTPVRPPLPAASSVAATLNYAQIRPWPVPPMLVLAGFLAVANERATVLEKN
jgi:hypothetical protein